MVEAENESIGMVLEIKYSESDDMEGACKEALKQIKEKGYEDRLVEDGMETILRYGIACQRKKCKVAVLI